MKTSKSKIKRINRQETTKGQLYQGRRQEQIFNDKYLQQDPKRTSKQQSNAKEFTLFHSHQKKVSKVQKGERTYTHITTSVSSIICTSIKHHQTNDHPTSRLQLIASLPLDSQNSFQDSQKSANRFKNEIKNHRSCGDIRVHQITKRIQSSNKLEHHKEMQEQQNSRSKFRQSSRRAAKLNDEEDIFCKGKIEIKQKVVEMVVDLDKRSQQSTAEQGIKKPSNNPVILNNHIRSIKQHHFCGNE